jgi:hypothetical protein
MTLSLVIPSTPNHFQYVDCIIKHYLNGTVIPDEIIISVSNSHQIDSKIFDSLNEKYLESYPNLIILKHTHMVPEGPNRGEGSKVAKYDLISYHDSDDIPHPQRIEIIKHFFNKFDINHLNHSYKYEIGFDIIDFEKIKYVLPNELYNSHFGENNDYTERPLDFFPNPNNKSYGCMSDFWVCGGPTTIHRSVLDTIKWNQDKILSYDYDFCMDVLFTLKKSIVIDSPLIWYNKVSNASWACE